MSARAADSAMRELVSAYDWSKTPLGPQQTWPASLRLAVELVLASGFPMAVRWGPEQVSIYNDAYAGILGDKHPRALGRPLREVWPEMLTTSGRSAKKSYAESGLDFFPPTTCGGSSGTA